MDRAGQHTRQRTFSNIKMGRSCSTHIGYVLNAYRYLEGNTQQLCVKRSHTRQDISGVAEQLSASQKRTMLCGVG